VYGNIDGYKSSPCGFIPAKTPLARALMPRQPYSVAVKSDGEERLHPLPFWKGRGLGSELRTPSSQEGDREVEKFMITTRIEPPLLTGSFDTVVTVDTKANMQIYLRNKIR